MANEQNLKPNQIRSGSEAREKGRKGGKASGQARRDKRDLRERAMAWMEVAADPRVAAAMSKTGVPVADNADVILAGVMKGVLKGDVKAINLWMELTGQNTNSKEAEKRKAEAEARRAEMETELFEMRMNAIKGIDQPEMPDDGFLEALKGTAGEDWSDEAL